MMDLPTHKRRCHCISFLVYLYIRVDGVAVDRNVCRYFAFALVQQLFFSTNATFSKSLYVNCHLIKFYQYIVYL